MKQSKFSLADVLTVLTALVFGFICFLGKNFSTLGNTLVSISWGVIIAVLLAGTAFAAKLLKRTSRNFKTNFILEIGALLLFTSFTVYFTYSSFTHYFNVSAKKSEIQKKLQTSIIQAENMFAEYEEYARNRERAYNGALVAAKKIENPIELKKYGFKDKSQIPYDTQIGHKMSTLHADLFPNNYSNVANKNGIKEVATTWLTKARNDNNNWKAIGVVNVVNNVEKNSNDWLNKLIAFSQQVNVKGGEYQPFTYRLAFVNLKEYFTTTGKPTPLTISLAAMVYLLMLLSWFVTKRHSRSTGTLTSVPYEVVL